MRLALDQNFPITLINAIGDYLPSTVQLGALLLELPGIPRRIRPRRANVFRLAYRQRPPTDAWDHFKAAAARHRRDPTSCGARSVSPTKNSRRQSCTDESKDHRTRRRPASSVGPDHLLRESRRRPAIPDRFLTWPVSRHGKQAAPGNTSGSTGRVWRQVPAREWHPDAHPVPCRS